MKNWKRDTRVTLSVIIVRREKINPTRKKRTKNHRVWKLTCWVRLLCLNRYTTTHLNVPTLRTFRFLPLLLLLLPFRFFLTTLLIFFIINIIRSSKNYLVLGSEDANWGFLYPSWYQIQFGEFSFLCICPILWSIDYELDLSFTLCLIFMLEFMESWISSVSDYSNLNFCVFILFSF